MESKKYLPFCRYLCSYGIKSLGSKPVGPVLCLFWTLLLVNQQALQGKKSFLCHFPFRAAFLLLLRLVSTSACLS